MSDTIHVQFELPFSREKVWRALTEPAVLAKWLMPVKEMKAVVGRALDARRARC